MSCLLELQEMKQLSVPTYSILAFISQLLARGGDSIGAHGEYEVNGESSTSTGSVLSESTDTK